MTSLPYIRMLLKAAAPELLPHQERAVERAQRDNLLIAHGLGSGKTLTSLEAARRIGRPAVVLTPASLTGNYAKELSKHFPSGLGRKVDIRSIAGASLRDEKLPPNSTIVVDEAHGLRNVDTDRVQWLKRRLPATSRLLLLTGTPTYNRPSDLAAIVNLLHGDAVLPENPAEFDRQFLASEKVRPGWLARLRGVKAGERQTLTNTDRLTDLLRGKVDLHETVKEHFPRRKDEDIRVDMSPEQLGVYRYLQGGLPTSIGYKIRSGLPPSKTEARSLNSFLVGLRQAGLSPGPYMSDVSPLRAARLSPKLQRAADELEKRMRPGFKAFVYTNFIEAGAEPLSAELTERGIPHAIFHGGLPASEKRALVDAYNDGRLPVLIGTSSASEGLDLKGTRLIQVLDPHFNESRIEQAIGRGIRYKSHDHLPAREREVLVQRYYAQPPPYGRLRRMLSRRDRDLGADEWLANMAKEKQQVFDQLRQVMTEASRTP